MIPVTSITVIYDAACGVCTRTREWTLKQTPLVNVQFLAADSAERRQRFPQLPAGELAVVADTGDVWLGDQAWIVCLWALRDYRDLAIRLTSPILLTMAKQAFWVVSKNRLALSRLLSLKSERQVELELRKAVLFECQSERK